MSFKFHIALNYLRVTESKIAADRYWHAREKCIRVLILLKAYIRDRACT